MKNPSNPLTFECGARMKNRFMLAPLTNTQSNEDGTLSEAEFNWLIMRAKGGFGLIMTCAAHVQEIGKGFPGQLGIFSDKHIEGHTKLSRAIKDMDSLAVIQLHHAGMRSPENVINNQPVCPSENAEHNARSLSFNEVLEVRDQFIEAAKRAKKAGYDGVEIHGAHGYLLCQFLSKEINKRQDEYGGSLENRSRILLEIVNGIRTECGNSFLIGVRLSPERFGMELAEVKQLSQNLIDLRQIDFLDISLWDCFKYPEDPKHKNQTLLEHFTNLNLKHVKLTVAGNINSSKDVSRILSTTVDFVAIGKSAILHHDFPKQVIKDPDFETQQLPVSKTYLLREGLSDSFIKYLGRWPNFIK